MYAVPLLLVLCVPASKVETHFQQLSPEPKKGQLLNRSWGQPRAVVLLHGLHIHPFSQESAKRAQLHTWQKPHSDLVRALADHADVYAFAYSQNVPVEAVLPDSDLLAAVCLLHAEGYREIVLVGHSAGGVIARQLVEDHPQSGVTKVIQVCSPNSGSSWARLSIVREVQRPFLRSLTKQERQRDAGARRDRTIPSSVEFVCVVGTGSGVGDGVVRRSCQWDEDLQRQGVPAIVLPVTHWQAMRNDRAIDTLVDLVHRRVPRWTPQQVEQARRQVLAD